MIDADIHKLSEQEPVPPLDSLEADIWAGITARAVARKNVRHVALWQSAVMAVAMVASGAVGLAVAALTEPAYASVQTLSGTDLAPSYLLFGSHQ